jgi:hypothetical protein
MNFWKTVRFSIQKGMKSASLETLMVVVWVNVDLKTNRVDEGTNWDAFQNNLKELFDEEWHTTSNDVNQL